LHDGFRATGTLPVVIWKCTGVVGF
jgi:hypothetical protein